MPGREKRLLKDTDGMERWGPLGQYKFFRRTRAWVQVGET